MESIGLRTTDLCAASTYKVHKNKNPLWGQRNPHLPLNVNQLAVLEKFSSKYKQLWDLLWVTRRTPQFYFFFPDIELAHGSGVSNSNTGSYLLAKRAMSTWVSADKGKAASVSSNVRSQNSFHPFQPDSKVHHWAWHSLLTLSSTIISPTLFSL